MTNKTKHLSSILLLDEKLSFDNVTLATSLSPTYQWYWRLDPLIYHHFTITTLILCTTLLCQKLLPAQAWSKWDTVYLY